MTVGWRVGIGGAALAGLGVLVRVVGWSLIRVALPALAAPRRAESAVMTGAVGDSIVTVAIERDPFRFARRPSIAAYDLVRGSEPQPPPPLKPVLVLLGVVWDGGENPTALIGGFPGVDVPRVVRTGDVVAGLRVKEITSMGVRITGVDTTWMLRVREP